MRKRGDRVKITTGKYGGHSGTVESNVYQRTVDYPDGLANGFHVMLETGVLVTVRWEQVEPADTLTYEPAIKRGSSRITGASEIQLHVARKDHLLSRGGYPGSRWRTP